MSMFEKLLSIYIGHRWQSFCGLDREEFVQLATEALDDLSYEYTHEDIETTGGEQFMLGAGDDVDQITVDEPEPFTV